MAGELDELNASMKMLNNTVNEILMWIKISSYSGVNEVIHREFDNPNDNEEIKELKRKIYILTDGENSSRDIEKLINGKIKFASIATYQRRWRRQGLANATDPTNPQSKTRRLFDLDDFI